ncbi:MAG: FG-GAP-like repeat-containing protein [Pleurocapsa sp. MO_192.B19]|nr:FG-GAP-like repeat-containing protein [Pleurocapsa sp. MO_192.B19]
MEKQILKPQLTQSSKKLKVNRMLVAIDPRVKEYGMLAAGVRSDTQLLILDPNLDGVAQITEALARDNYASLHIVCHGAPGCLYLGKTLLSLVNIDQYRQQMLEWGVADILLYACNVAAHSTTFLHRLHELTAANIAASPSLIGHASLGGSWELTYNYPSNSPSCLSPNIPFSTASLAVYPATLALSFAPAVSFGTRGGSAAVVVEDFNGDGKPDLVTGNGFDNSVSVLLGDGSGGFGTQTSFAVGFGPFAVAVEDFNGDAKPDLVTANIYADTVSVLLGDGSGGFGTQTSFAVGKAPFAVAVGDFNGNGKPDLVTTNFNADTISVLLGDGSGGFGTQTTFAVGDGPAAVAVEDFNGDGKPDLVTTRVLANTVSVLLGDGSGGFGTQTSFAVGEGPVSVAVEDFNGDNKLDLATANSFDQTISVLLGDGSGGFGPQTTFGVGKTPFSITVGDFNGDTKPDIVTANADDNTVSVLLGDGSGGFGTQTTFGVGVRPSSIAVGDFNSDAKPDLVTANELDGNVSVLLNTTTKKPKLVTGTPGDDVFDSVISDETNFDGDKQILFTGSSDDTVDVSLAPGGNRIDLGSGDDLLFAGTNNRILAGAGDDLLFGGYGGGNNVITGGSGMDQFWIVTDVIDLPAKANIITDFTIEQQDVIGFANTSLDFSQLTLLQDGSNTIINALDQNLAVLGGVQASSLSQANFVFA